VYHRSDWGSERRGYTAIELAAWRESSLTSYPATNQWAIKKPAKKAGFFS